MNVSLEKSSNTLGKLTIALAPEDYKAKVEKQVKNLALKANIKGFRPGKVPVPMIQKLYGKSILIDEINTILSETLQEYIRENKLQIVGDPMPDRAKAEAVNWENPTDLEFAYDLGMASDFTVDFDTLPAVNAFQIEAGEAELNKTIEDLRTRFGGHSHPEEVVEGDLVQGEMKQTAGEWSLKTGIPTQKLSDSSKKLFAGAKKDDTLLFDVQSLFPDAKSLSLAIDMTESEAAALAGEYSFQISSIQRDTTAELDQAFFDKVLGPGQAEDEATFRTKLLEIVQGNYKREAEFLLEDDLVKNLTDNIAIELPDEFLKNWILESQEGKFTAAEIEQDYDKFTKDLKWTLIRNKIAETADVKVEYEDVLGKTKQMFKEQFGMMMASQEDDQTSQLIDRLAVSYLTDKEKRENFTNMFNRVFADKVMDVVKASAKVENKTIDVEGFKLIGA